MLNSQALTLMMGEGRQMPLFLILGLIFVRLADFTLYSFLAYFGFQFYVASLI